MMCTYIRSVFHSLGPSSDGLRSPALRPEEAPTLASDGFRRAASESSFWISKRRRTSTPRLVASDARDV